MSWRVRCHTSVSWLAPWSLQRGEERRQACNEARRVHFVGLNVIGAGPEVLSDVGTLGNQSVATADRYDAVGEPV